MLNTLRAGGNGCDPNEIALKSFFLGPQAENADWINELVQTLFLRWADWRRSLHPADGRAISVENLRTKEFIERKEMIESVSLGLLKRFEDEVPKFSPRYVGHMFSDFSLPALLGHLITLLHNPNNISGESSKIGTQIENEAIQSLLEMVGYPITHGTGHFTSGGTVANIEAVIRARARCALWLSNGSLRASRGHDQIFDPFPAAHSGWKSYENDPANHEEAKSWNFERMNAHLVYAKIESLTRRPFLGPVILVPENKHYSWNKACRILGYSDDALWPIELDSQGTLSLLSLKQRIEDARREGRPILLVVSVVGTTELGSIDPVDKVQTYLDLLREKENLHIWHHVDAAYGGFLRTIDRESSTLMPSSLLASLTAIQRSTSITLDPHKLGYVPYASGTFLVRDRRDYFFSTFDHAPYIDFDSNIDRGPYTIEGSRSAAGAVASWMTANTMGLHSKGYGLLLERTIRIRKSLETKLRHANLSIQFAPGCETNIMCFSCAKRGERISESNARTLKVYADFSAKKNGEFIVSKTNLKFTSYGEYLRKWVRDWDAEIDHDELVLVRMCMMNPFFDSVESTVDYSALFSEKLRESLVGL